MRPIASTLRDAAHSARRLLQQLWVADEATRLCTRACFLHLGLAPESVLQSMIVIAEVMANALGMFHLWRDSPGQLVHHNKELLAGTLDCFVCV